MKTINVTYTVRIPTIPNFFVTQEGQTIPINAIKESGLRKIGKEWTEELVKQAKDKSGH